MSLFHSKIKIGFFSGVMLLCATSCITAKELILSEQPRYRLNTESTSEQVEPYTFIYGPVDKVKHEVSFTRSVKLFGKIHRRTYETPTDIGRNEAFGRYRSALLDKGGEILFECEGRDCGRATIWGNEIFKERELSTIDKKQSFLAGTVQVDGAQKLISVYVVERANHRVFAHIVEVAPESNIEFATNTNIDGKLARDGIVHIEGVIPDQDGKLSNESIVELRRIAREQLTAFTDESIYVVCHLAGSLSSEELVANSQECAETISALLAEEAGFEILAFGVGPFAPLDGVAQSRIELIIPKLLPLD